VSRRLAHVLAALALGAVVLAETASAQPAPPLEAILVLDNPPTNLTFDGATPIRITLGLRNVSGGPIITTDRFSATDFWRQLFFTLDGVGVITDAGAAAVHAFAPFGTCHYRNSAVLPGAGIQVVPVEVLPSDFQLAFAFDDAGKHFDLTHAGRYTVTAKVSFFAYDPAAVIDDCDVEFKGESLLSIGDLGAVGRREYEIVSNSLQFVVQPPDATAPTTTAVATPAPSAAGWHDTDVSLALTAADDPGGSGVKQVRVSFFGAQADPPQTFPGSSAVVTISTEGATTVFYQAADNAGNTEEVRSETVRVDQTPPVVTPPSSISVAPTEGGGARGSASAALADFLGAGGASDNLDPAPAPLAPQVNGVSADSTTLFPLGTTTVVFRFQDVAGNIGSANSSVTVAATSGDGTAPSTTATPTTAATSVTVALAAQDDPGGSGVQQITYSLSGAQSGGAVVPGASTSVVISAKGITTLSYFATDKAGNQESPKTLTVQVAVAANTSCTGAMAGTFKNVVVPDGASCGLSGAMVDGNVQVKRDASLSIGPVGTATIRGNVQADHCRSVALAGAVTVEGNVQIQQCTADSGYAGPGVQIGGNFQCHDNSGACRAVNGSVDGNVQVDNNKSASRSDISGNAIRGNLQCKGNVPAPIHSASNTARKKDGQCDASLGF
jgi:hypothetical protein